MLGLCCCGAPQSMANGAWTGPSLVGDFLALLDGFVCNHRPHESCGISRAFDRGNPDMGQYFQVSWRVHVTYGAYAGRPHPALPAAVIGTTTAIVVCLISVAFANSRERTLGEAWVTFSHWTGFIAGRLQAPRKHPPRRTVAHKLSLVVSSHLCRYNLKRRSREWQHDRGHC